MHMTRKENTEELFIQIRAKDLEAEYLKRLKGEKPFSQFAYQVVNTSEAKEMSEEMAQEKEEWNHSAHSAEEPMSEEEPFFSSFYEEAEVHLTESPSSSPSPSPSLSQEHTSEMFSAPEFGQIDSDSPLSVEMEEMNPDQDEKMSPSLSSYEEFESLDSFPPSEEENSLYVETSVDSMLRDETPSDWAEDSSMPHQTTENTNFLMDDVLQQNHEPSFEDSLLEDSIESQKDLSSDIEHSLDTLDTTSYENKREIQQDILPDSEVKTDVLPVEKKTPVKHSHTSANLTVGSRAILQKLQEEVQVWSTNNLKVKIQDPYSLSTASSEDNEEKSILSFLKIFSFILQQDWVQDILMDYTGSKISDMTKEKLDNILQEVWNLPGVDAFWGRMENLRKDKLTP